MTISADGLSRTAVGVRQPIAGYPDKETRPVGRSATSRQGHTEPLSMRFVCYTSKKRFSKVAAQLTISSEDLLNVLKTGSGRWHVEELADRLSPKFDGPRDQLLRKINQLATNHSEFTRGDTHYLVYLPVFRTGASMIQPFPMGPFSAENEEIPLVLWLPELIALLWPERIHRRSLVTWHLEEGPSLKVRLKELDPFEDEMSPTLRSWLTAVSRHASAITVTCVDGAKAEFQVRPSDAATPRADSSDAAIRSAANKIMGKSRYPMELEDVARELMARGLYHSSLPPRPLLDILLHPVPVVQQSPGGVGFKRLSQRPTAKVLALLEAKNPEWAVDNLTYWENTGGMIRSVNPAGSVPSVAPSLPAGVYRIEVKFVDADVSRVIAIASTDTFTDLHRALLSAIDWEDGDPWVFSLSRNQRIPEIGIAPGGELEASSTSLASVGFKVGQTFAYSYDHPFWGEFVLTVLAFAPGQKIAAPIVVESHGQAPTQFPGDEDEEYGESIEEGETSTNLADD